MIRKTLQIFGLVVFVLQAFSSTALTEVRYRRTHISDQLLNLMTRGEIIGLTSAVWSDSTADSTAGIEPVLESIQKDSVQAKVPSKEFEPLKPEVPVGQSSVQRIGPIVGEPQPIHGDQTETPFQTSIGTTDPTSAASDAPFATITSSKGLPDKDDELKQEKEIVKRETIATPAGLPVTTKTEYDTTTGYIIIKNRLAGSKMPIIGALTPDQYLHQSIIIADRDSWRSSVMKKLPTSDESESGAIQISIPVFKSRSAQRIFGGSDIGLSVSGNIRVDGSLRLEKRDTQSSNTPDPTNYHFKVDQSQQFVIKGKVGEKVSVEIDQDSERLFEFENNIRIRYEGGEDEMIQSIEAGNVSMSLRGASLVSVSTRHEGLFGFKTTSKIGALNLTTITSIKKGESQEIKIDGGAQEGRPVNIMPNDFVWRRYYFLDTLYRENYRHRDQNLLSRAADEALQIVKIEVYKSVSTVDDFNVVQGWALADPDSSERISDPDADIEGEQAYFSRLIQGTDYYASEELGYIRLKTYLNTSEVLAVAYVTADGKTYGDIIPPAPNDTSATFILKLLQPKFPNRDDSTWDLMWRNVYDLRAIKIDASGFEGRITLTTGDSEDEADVDNTPYIELFGLDHFGEGSSAPDGRIDDIFINYGLGELIFPDLQPFDPIGWKKGGVTIITDIDSTLRTPTLYTEKDRQIDEAKSDFKLVVQYKSVSATYSLGFNVLEGSVEVFMNGARLSQGMDYTMDYLSGELTLLRPEALSPTASIEIKYETGELFQTDTETLLGVNAEYELWDNSSVGMTFAYYNEKKLDRRVRVGGEPTRNTIWDLNARLEFKPYFLTRAVDWLPLIETDKSSTFTISGEMAQVYPDPNSLNSPSTGDYNGVAYIDDFESVKRTTPLGITMVLWRHSSFPIYDDRGAGSWLKQRGRLLWYNPLTQIPITDIWPDREVEAQASTIPVLLLRFQPWWDEMGTPNPPQSIDPTRSWGGIMRYLGTGYADQSRSKYIEIWLNRGGTSRGMMYIDLGRLSEDVLPDGKLNTEDQSTDSFPFGDGILADHEDVGFDQVAGEDPADSTDINGDGILLPSFDDWQPYSERNYLHINGTEGNRGFESGRYPDTEDLDNDGSVGLSNDFYRYRIDLSDLDNPYIVGGQDNVKGWRLYRIPLTDTLVVGKPSFTEIEGARIWFTGFNQRSNIMIAQLEIVGNEWQEVSVENERGERYDPVSLAVINTHDNRDEYTPPPGVSGERDPVTNLQAREQALAIRINRLKTGETGMVTKVLPSRQKLDLLEYRQLKMYIHGGGRDTTLRDRFGRDLDLEIFFRFGSDSSARSPDYYEYSQRLKPGWEENDLFIDFERITALKFLRIQDSTRNYDILPNGAIIRVLGQPSLSRVEFFTIGIKNHGPDIIPADQIEIWCDEIRVSEVIRNPGWAAKGSVSLSIADFITMSADIRQNQADFHRIELRTGSRKDNLSGRFNSSIKLNQLFSPNLGLRMPLSFTYNQSIDVPRYLQNSDVKLSSVTDERIDIWSKFRQDLLSNDRFRGDPVFQNELESEILASKSYAFSTNISKSKKSDNLLLRYTLDGIGLSGSYKEEYSVTPTRLFNIHTRSEGGISYNLSIDDPVELNWMRWSQNIPILKKISESTFRPLPSSFSASANGTEDIRDYSSRPKAGTPGRLTEQYSFNISRNYRVGFRPVTPLSFDLSQEFTASRVRDDTLRSIYASMLVDTAELDTTRWEEDYWEKIEQVKHDIYWKAFGGHFLDNYFRQTFGTSFSPVILSWLGTEASYQTNYDWSWNLGQVSSTSRSVHSNGRFSSSLTFRLPQILNSLGIRREDKKAVKDPLDGMPPWAKDDPDPNMPYKPPPGEKSPDETPLDPFQPEPLIDETQPDTTVKRERTTPRPQDLLIPLKAFVTRLKDIRWSFNKSDDYRNFSVGSGQADWLYRLALTGDPGLGRISGLTTPDVVYKTWDHSISSGLDITPNLHVSSLEYQFGETHTFRNDETGTSKRTVLQMFDKDKVSIKAIPFVNYSLRWSGWERLPLINKISQSVSLDHSFRGDQSESWRKTDVDIEREVQQIEYERSFSPLLGISLSWKGGVSTNIRYNLSRRVYDARGGAQTKTMDNTRTISLSASFTSNRGFRIPIPIWPFSGRRLKNRTSFSLSYDNSLTQQKNSNGGNPFEESNRTASWSFRPSLEYSFSNTVRGSVHYEYAVQDSKRSGETKSHDFGFSVNISIRG